LFLPWLEDGKVLTFLAALTNTVNESLSIREGYITVYKGFLPTVCGIPNLCVKLDKNLDDF